MNIQFEHRTISEFLNAEFDRRKRRNDSYSLRAFARDIKVSSSRLSEILKGQNGLSEKTADTIADNLNLKSIERQFWKDLILSECSRSPKVRELASKRLVQVREAASFKQIKEEHFRVIADWYHSAILELTQVDSFREDPNWIAGRLGISEIQVVEAIERLLQLGLLTRAADGQLKADPEAFSAMSDVPSAAIRKYHRQVMTMGIESLVEDPMEDREHLSMVVAIPKAMLPEFHLEMQKFMTQFWQKIEKTKKDDLYALSMQLVPVRDRRRKG